MRLDHLLDGARRVAEVPVLRVVDRAHAAAADALDDLVATVENRARLQLTRSAARAARAPRVGRRARGQVAGLTLLTTFVVGLRARGLRRGLPRERGRRAAHARARCRPAPRGG